MHTNILFETDELVESGVMESISFETVRRICKNKFKLNIP